MKLLKLFCKKEIIATRGEVNIDIKTLSQKADKKVTDGLFFCINGISGDGHNFVEKAKENGCVALVVEKWVDSPLPQILVQNTRNILPDVCNRFYKNIFKNIKIVGVTGTNGKTTTTNIIYQMLLASGKKAGLIGTNCVRYLDKKIESKLTTPDTIDLYDIISDMKKGGVEFVIMEVSAHALYLNKLLKIPFEIGVFTNLTQDHLDFFGDMETYSNAKKDFLTKKYCKNVIINLDDDYGKNFARQCDTNLFTYGITNPAINFAMDVELSSQGSHFLLNIFDNVFDINSNMLCMFNVYNMLASAVCAKLLKISNLVIANVLSNVQKIDGRLNSYMLKSGVMAIIDYAHTPDGLEKVLSNIKQISNARLFVVFGCGGNRDRTKRPIMGKIANFYADRVVITSDNPRYENPREIINEIASGIKNCDKVEKIENRKQAIEYAISMAKCGDIVVIAGKGHENYQEINGKKNHFSDFEIIRQYLD